MHTICDYTMEDEQWVDLSTTITDSKDSYYPFKTKEEMYTILLLYSGKYNISVSLFKSMRFWAIKCGGTNIPSIDRIRRLIKSITKEMYAESDTQTTTTSYGN